ncbi:MAG TPA: hypothetical protein VGR26_09695 [Acidimicrobiales bacterium]|nr:hypothetical protein [Acidimicrobiales bacterium]
MLHPRGRITLSLLSAALLVGSACGDGAGGSVEAVCDEARAQSDVFTAEGFRTATPEIIGVLRDLAQEAPTPVRRDFEEVVEASSDAELHAALAEVERFLAQECGIEVVE